MERLEQALTAAQSFRPMGPSEVDALLAKTARAAWESRFELYETTQKHDSTTEQPEWLSVVS
jgi:hypothetical protein